MKPGKWVLRGAKWAGVSVLGLVLLLAILVQGQQWLLRWRAERLMADMHQIRLYQSTWADAQKLMHKWGRWGRFEGTCTSADCQYQITLGNSWFGVNDSIDQNWFDRVWLRLVASGIFATRVTALQTTFTVHNGAIWRSSFYMLVDVPFGNAGTYAGEYTLLVRVRSLEAMPGNRTNLTEQLEEHPYYYVSRPSGCMNCMMADVRFSTHTPQDQLAQLTSFDFGCITRFRPCRFLGEALPPAQNWRLYPGIEPYSPLALRMPRAPRPCSAPVWAIARDRQDAVVVNVITRGVEQSDWYGPREKDKVRVVLSLKGKPPASPGELIDVIPFSDEQNDWLYETPEHLEMGRSYVLFFNGTRDNSKLPMIDLERCGAQFDGREVRNEVVKGVAMNDDLREPGSW